MIGAHRRRPLLAAIVVGVLAVLGCGGAGHEAPVVEVYRGDFEDVLTVTGRLAAAETAVVQSSTRGTISFMVAEGTEVKEGDPVFGLETEDIQESLHAAQLDLAVAEAALAKAEEEARLDRVRNDLSLREKRAQLEFSKLSEAEARENLEKAKRQHANQILSQSELSTADLAAKQAVLTVSNAEIDLQRLEQEIASRLQTLELDRRSAVARAEKARNEVAEADEFLSKATARAPRSGIVVHAKGWRGEPVRVGEQVWRNMAVMEIPDLSEMQVECEVHEVDISRLGVDARAHLRVEAFPNLSLAGTVKEIGGLARELKDHEGRGTGVRVFDVVIALDEQVDGLRPGMTATVRLVVDRREQVLLIPTGAVRGPPDARHVLSSSGREMPVEVAAMNDDHAVIASGLEEGDEILLAPDEEAAPASVGDAEAPPAPPEPSPETVGQ